MRKSWLLFPLLVLSSCGGIGDSSKEELSVYLDYSKASTSQYSVRVSSASAHSYSTENYNFSISICIKNLTSETQVISFSNIKLIRESNGASYAINNGYPSKISIDSEIESTVSFASAIPTSLEENYYFSLDFKNINYKVYLYETPDELREDLTVSYVINRTIVHTETVKKGRTLPVNYVYDTNDHQNYASTWKDTSGRQYSQGTKIEENVTLTGTIQENLKISTTSTDIYSFVNGINHVHSDGKVVVADKYQNKEVCLSNFAIYNNPQVKEVYFPKTLHKIYSNNFNGCGYLKKIYYAGTEDEWNAIQSSSTIPSGVNLVFNTSFRY